MVYRRSLANLLATETALLTRRQQSADHKDKVCQVGVTVNTECSLDNYPKEGLETSTSGTN